MQGPHPPADSLSTTIMQRLIVKVLSLQLSKQESETPVTTCDELL